jgi:hypothetical protein
LQSLLCKGCLERRLEPETQLYRKVIGFTAPTGQRHGGQYTWLPKGNRSRQHSEEPVGCGGAGVVDVLWRRSYPNVHVSCTLVAASRVAGLAVVATQNSLLTMAWSAGFKELSCPLWIQLADRFASDPGPIPEVLAGEHSRLQPRWFAGRPRMQTPHPVIARQLLTLVLPMSCLRLFVQPALAASPAAAQTQPRPEG